MLQKQFNSKKEKEDVIFIVRPPNKYYTESNVEKNEYMASV